LGVGIAGDRVILDPGIGFGKRAEHNWALLGGVETLVGLGQPVLVGASRKRFIGVDGGGDRPRSRLAGSLACAVMAAVKGAAILRVHDVAETVAALRSVHQIRRFGGGVTT
jgi:dihydropteroate synthase